MKTQIFKMVFFVALIAMFSNCTSLDKIMREPNTRVNLNKEDFTLSEQVTAEATSVKILGIDWSRLFISRTGAIQGGVSSAISLASIPVIGNFIADKTANYSLYELMNDNPGYDVVFYPQYETKISRPALGIGFLTTITTVKTTARLGKLNNTPALSDKKEFNEGKVIKESNIPAPTAVERNYTRTISQSVADNNPFKVGDIVKFTDRIDFGSEIREIQINRGIIYKIEGNRLFIEYIYMDNTRDVEKDYNQVKLAQ